MIDEKSKVFFLARESKDESTLLQEMFLAYQSLRSLGWQEAWYSKSDPTIKLLLIEAGSTGIHNGFRTEDGSFWIVDDVDTWPSHPILAKKA